MDKNSFLKCQSEILAFRDLVVQLEHSANSDHIALGYLNMGMNKICEVMDALQKENTQLREEICVLKEENKILQDINDSLANQFVN